MRHAIKREIVKNCMLYDSLKRRMLEAKDERLKQKILKKIEFLEDRINKLRQKYYSELQQDCRCQE